MWLCGNDDRGSMTVKLERKCSHGEVEFLGEQKGEKGVNKYYRCLKCGSVLILSEEQVLYEIPGAGLKRST